MIKHGFTKRKKANSIYSIFFKLELTIFYKTSLNYLIHAIVCI